ncbi:hypothetical protein, partial [Rhodococcus ruber]
SGFQWIWLWRIGLVSLGVIWPSNVMAKAFSVGFHLIAHRALPFPVGSCTRNGAVEALTHPAKADGDHEHPVLIDAWPRPPTPTTTEAAGRSIRRPSGRYGWDAESGGAMPQRRK